MNAPQPKTFSERFPAYLTHESAAACLQASKQRRAEVLQRRAVVAKTQRVRAEVEQAVETISRAANVVPFPGRAA